MSNLGQNHARLLLFIFESIDFYEAHRSFRDICGTNLAAFDPFDQPCSPIAYPNINESCYLNLLD
jgi:hypothetical protein